MMTSERPDLDAIRQRVDRHESATGKGARQFLASALAADVPALLAEIDRLTAEVDDKDAELSTLRADLDFQTRAAFDNQAEANRQQQRAERLRDMHDRAAKELSAERANVMRLAMTKVWTNEDGKRFMFVADIQAALGLPTEDTLSEPERAL